MINLKFMKNDKPKLTAYLRLERELIRVFRYFGDLCKFCFEQSLEKIKAERGIDTHELCCCLVDNQILDHWRCVDEAQKTIHGPSWRQKKSSEAGSGFAGNSDWLGIGRRRLPGNGPCLALSNHGCVLANLRPPTCSTQLCPKMLRILNNLGLIKGKTAAPRQIEDFKNIKSPLNALFGLNRETVTPAEIDNFLKLIHELEQQFRQIPAAKWQEAIVKEKNNFSQLIF
jgi:hypothetical protein